MKQIAEYIFMLFFVAMLIVMYRFGYEAGVSDQKLQTDFLQQQYNTLLEIDLDRTIELDESVIQHIPDSAFVEYTPNSCEL